MRHEVRNSKLRAIYEQVPDFNCAEECKGECCGELITHIAIEWSQIVRYLRRNKRPVPTREMHLKQKQLEAVIVGILHGVTVKRLKPDCSFLKDGRCSVYPVRPLVCRLFGLIVNDYLMCPKVEPPKDAISQKKVDELMWELSELNREFVKRRKKRKKRK